MGCIHPSEHGEDSCKGTAGSEGQHLRFKTGEISTLLLQLQPATSRSPGCAKHKAVIFARGSRLLMRGAQPLHQERKIDQAGAGWLLCQGCCRIRKACLSSCLKLQMHAARLGLQQAQHAALQGKAVWLQWAYGKRKMHPGCDESPKPKHCSAVTPTAARAERGALPSRPRAALPCGCLSGRRAASTKTTTATNGFQPVQHSVFPTAWQSQSKGSV